MGLGLQALKKTPAKILGYLWDHKGKIIVGSLGFAAFASMTSLYFKQVYQVKTGEGYILTEKSGKKVPVVKEKWYFRAPFVTDLEGPIKLFNQSVYLDGKQDPHEVIAKDDYVLNASAVTFIEIEDLYKFLVLNVDGKKMLQDKLDSVIGYQLRQTIPNELIHKTDTVAGNIYSILKLSSIEKDFGIKIKSFNLLKTSYIDKVVQANADKQRLQAESEGRFAAAQKEAETINKIAQAGVDEYRKFESAVNPKTIEEKIALLNYLNNRQKWKALRERPNDNTWIITEGENKPVIGMDPNMSAETRKRIKNLEDSLKEYKTNRYFGNSSPQQGEGIMIR